MTATQTDATAAIEAETGVTVIVSLMVTGAGAVTETIDEEMEAALDQAKVLTQMKTVIGVVVAVLETAVEAVAVTAEAIFTAEVDVRAPAPLVVTASMTGTVIGPATAAATVVTSVATAAATTPRPSPKSPRMIVISAPSLSSRSRSVRRPAICAPSSSE